MTDIIARSNETLARLQVLTEEMKGINEKIAEAKKAEEAEKAKKASEEDQLPGRRGCN